MLRKYHSIPGLAAAVLVSFMALTGAFLSLQPLVDHIQTGKSVGAEQSVAAVAANAAAEIPGVERIVRTASGSVIAYASGDNGLSAQYIDPTTGQALGEYQPSAVFQFVMELHRSLFFGDAGHIAAGLAALAMVLLALSGTLLLVNRMGGWSKVFSATKGSISQRLHVEVSRLSILLLLLTAVTGVYMSLVYLGVVPSGLDGFVPFPADVNGGTPAPIGDLSALQAIPLQDLRELIFPYAGDLSDVFTVTTNAGQGFVDQATGNLLSFTANTPAQSAYETIYMLHTGQGVWLLGVLLGMAALAVPVLSVSGGLVWWRRQKGAPKLANNASHKSADTIILVGSEGNSTWGFAANLHNSLVAAGHRVHTAPMNALAHEYRHAERLFVLTATYGDGAAPQSANRFLDRLAHLKHVQDINFAVLGFGDRRFAQFCRFACDVEDALLAKGMTPMRAIGTIDRQSPQTFAKWGREIGERIGTPLELTHAPEVPRTTALALTSRVDYGTEVQEPTAVLRFASVRPASFVARLFGRKHAGLPHFEVGDLVGIVPPGSVVPRYYSLASSSHEGELEICVRRQPGGLCSEFLHRLEVGETIDSFVRTNPGFRPARGSAPVIMIGAGTGIAPLAGFIKGNKGHRPMYLFWGGRHPQSDFLYEEMLSTCLADARLTRLITAFSRAMGGAYVQNKVKDNGEEIRELIERGAQIMVCGGREMADGVLNAVEDIVAPLGLNVHTLKAQGRYVEDVY